MELQTEEKESFAKENIPMPRYNILLRKLAMPEQVRLPIARTYSALYERVNRGTLAPTNVKIRRTYRHSIGLRQQRLKYFWTKKRT